MSSDAPILAALREAIIVKAGLSVTDAAERLGISRPALSNVMNGNASLSIPLAIKIERAFGLSARALLVMQLDHEIVAAGGDPPSAEAKPIEPKPLKKAASASRPPAPRSQSHTDAIGVGGGKATISTPVPVLGTFKRPIYQKGSKK